MTEMKRTESVARESAILVGVLLDDRTLAEDPLDELAGLADTAGARVVGQLTQRREAPDVTTYLGKGKVEELKQLAAATDADVVIFDNDLSPGPDPQSGESARHQGARPHRVDSRHLRQPRPNRTKPAWPSRWPSLQYSLPRLKRMWTHLSRLKMGVGMRGPGEKQLEVDRRLVEKRIHDLRPRAEGIEQRKEREVAARQRPHDRFAGRLHQRRQEHAVERADRSRRVGRRTNCSPRSTRGPAAGNCPAGGPVLLSDTVGFIRDLPHHLIASFKATLEEARQADLLLHVADASDPAALAADRGRL